MNPENEAATAASSSGTGLPHQEPPMLVVAPDTPAGAVAAGRPPKPRQAFFWPVPDHVLVDRSRVISPTADAVKMKKNIWRGLVWLIHSFVIAHRRAKVTVPDYLFAQVLWGGSRAVWPKNWRSQVVAQLKRLCGGTLTAVGGPPDTPAKACPPYCPMHQRGLRHGHLTIVINAIEPDAVNWADADADDAADPVRGMFLGVLELCGNEAGEDTQYQFSKPPAVPRPRKPPRGTAAADADPAAGQDDEDSQVEGRLSSLRATWRRRTASAYFPLLLFGASPRLGLKAREQLLMRAVCFELTRDPAGGSAKRPDRAQVITAGPPAASVSNRPAAFPGLPRGQRYVGFNGNGSGKKAQLHGRGYKLASWMQRAKYLPGWRIADDDDAVGWTVPATITDIAAAADEEQERKKVTATFLKDLARLADMFGLVVAAWHGRRREWEPLAALAGKLASAAGRRWLKAATLRIYTADDYLTRWRGLIADRMGFSDIPAANDERVEAPGPAGSPAGLRAFMAANNLTQKAFAAAVGVRQPALSRRLSGDLSWSPAWTAKVEACLARHPEWGRPSA